MSQQKPDDTIEIDLDLDELDATSAETKSDLSGNQRLCAERIWLEGFKFIYFSNQKEMWNRSRREL
mgnify:CR=1 FL=1